MADIPDEAVQAAWDIIQDRDGFEDMRDALAAALPHLSPDPWAAQNQAMAERIKELEDAIANLWVRFGPM